MISAQKMAPTKEMLLLNPEPSDIPTALSQNDEIFKNLSFKISGLSAKDFRSETRKELLSLAKKYTASLYKDQAVLYSKEIGNDSTIIQTGHQPGFFHPGIAVKYSLLNLLSKQLGGRGVNLAVDSDTADSTGFTIPSPLTNTVTPKLDLFPETGASPLEYIRAPSPENLKTFLSSIEKNLSPTLFASIRPKFLSWKGRVMGHPDKNLLFATDFFVIARRLFFREKEDLSLDIPVSSLSDSNMFFRFFLHIAEYAEEFRDTYNLELSRYRIAHRVRYPANPFPDLKNTGDALELPFWFFTKTKREPVYVKIRKGERIIFSGETELSAIPKKNNETDLSSTFRDHIRPKAIPLTLFNRLFFSDIFIHGTGGSKYDSITDGIIKTFFHTSPPKYLTASLSKFPTIPVFSESGKIEQLENTIRDITFNPDRYIDGSDEDIKRKRHLLDSIKQPGADRKTIGIEIKSINQKLLPRLNPLKQDLTSELSKLKNEEKRYEAFMRRDFPFFLFDPEEINSPLKHHFKNR